jgi:hypothetical protein
MVDDLGIEDLKQLLSFYKQRSNDLEFSNLQWQIKYNKILASNSKPIPATKVVKTKSE